MAAARDELGVGCMGTMHGNVVATHSAWPQHCIRVAGLSVEGRGRTLQSRKDKPRFLRFRDGGRCRTIEDNQDEATVGYGKGKGVMAWARWSVGRNRRRLVVGVTAALMGGCVGLASGELGAWGSHAMVLAQTPTAQQQRADDLVQQGQAAFQAERWADAFAAWQAAITLYEQLGDQAAVLAGWQSLGFGYLQIQDYPNAIAAFQTALPLAQTLNDQSALQSGEYWLGASYYYQQDYDNAIAAYQRSLAWAQTLDDAEATLQVLVSLGLAYAQQTDYVNAIPQYEAALDWAEAVGSQPQQMRILSMLGNIQHRLGHYESAIEYHQASLEIAIALKDADWQASTLNNLGLAYYWLNDYAPAIDAYEQSLAVMHQHGIATTNEGWVLFNLGQTYFYVGNRDRFLAYTQQSLDWAYQFNDRALLGSALNSLGNAVLNYGDYEQGRTYFAEALKITQEIGSLNDQANALSGLGLYYSLVQDYPTALDYYQQSLAIHQSIGNRYNEGVALENIGSIYLQLGEYEPAIAAFRQRLDISQTDQELYGEGGSLQFLGLAMLLKGDLPTAETYLRKGIQVLESIRGKLGDRDTLNVSIFENQRNLFNLLQRVLVLQQQPEAALEVAEQGRARAFAERVATRVSETTASPISADPPSLAEIKQIAARQNATLVQYSLVDPVLDQRDDLTAQIYIWVVQPNGTVTLRLGSLDQLEQPLGDLVMESRDAIGARGRGLGLVASAGLRQRSITTSRTQLQQLHHLLIDPIADLLPTDPEARVIIIPHRELFLVPFAALQAADGTYLIERHTLLTAPSIQVLGLTAHLHQATRRHSTDLGNDVLIVGNPTMPRLPNATGHGADLNPLPGAEKEARQIASLLKTTPLIGAQATETAVVDRLPQAGIVHLATHGLLDWGDAQNPDQADFPGAIALAATDTADGLLTTSEILALDLQADLVVLSACDTGRGRITGDGVVGLSRSLIAAGVPSVVVSLWSVPDAPTASLMTAFYHQLQQGKDKAQALRLAMLATQEQYPDPVNWAAFTLIGEGD